ncbi:Retron-type RNA-directed DNA polymerase [Candidatus Burkholderia pumila]|uniref:Retron-type RNA-directed DNA polymerase n=1 Tax=Candidatus Burkholderia pumila TaxID=1090375 RepID=A0ABR5HJV5_9BURK|nr:Retron-type RNA-directed DNA polymerase [Candidatus Burkholderia pumila]
MKRIDALKAASDEPGAQGVMRELDELYRKRENLRSSDPLDANYRRLVYIRYADDCLISVTGKQDEAVSTMQKVARFLGEKLHLEIASEKSGVVHATRSFTQAFFDLTVPSQISGEPYASKVHVRFGGS